MHGNLTRRVRHPLGLSDPFPVDRGVSQGAVESPWLYACFIDGLEQAFRTAGLGVFFAGRRVPLLMYADDMVLLAASAEELTKMNEVVTNYASKNRFQLNGKKSGVMAFNITKPQRDQLTKTQWSLFGNKVDVVNEYWYLGTLLTNNPTDWTRHLKEMIKKAERKTADLLWLFRRDRGLRPRTAVALWQAIVRPVLEYASEIWAGQAPKYITESAERVQMSFLRAILGLHKNGSGVSDEVVRAETGAEPLSARWGKLQLGYWHKAFSAPDSRLLKLVAVRRHRDFVSGVGSPGKGWIQAANANLTKYGLARWFANPGLAISAGIDWKKAVYNRVEAWHDGSRAASLLAKPNAATYSQVKSWDKNTEDYCERSGEIGKLGMLVFAPYLDDRFDHKGTRLKLLCRTNSLPTLSRVGREVSPAWPENLRTCPLCPLREVESVYHFVMSCHAYTHHRKRLITRVARAHSPFCSATYASQFLTLMGKRTGNCSTDKRIDRMVKVYLRKCWNVRQPITNRINRLLGTTYSLFPAHNIR